MKKVIKIILIAFLVAINGALLFRVLITFNKNELTALEPSAALSEAFANDGDVKVLTHKTIADLSTNRSFCAYALAYVPDAREFQVTARFNKSAYRNAGLGEDGQFDFYLWDTDTDEETKGEVVGVKDWLMYRFVRVSFRDAELKEGDGYGLVVKAGDAATDDIQVHHKEQTWNERSLSSGEKRALMGD